MPEKTLKKCPKCGERDIHTEGIHTFKSLSERKPMSFFCHKCWLDFRWYPRTGKITERGK